VVEMGRLLRQHWTTLVAVFVATALVTGPAIAASFLTKRQAKRLFYTKSISDQRYYRTGVHGGQLGEPELFRLRGSR
jgi:hypothetical protein